MQRLVVRPDVGPGEELGARIPRPGMTEGSRLSICILVLIASLLCAACSTDDTTRKQDPHVFGSASGANGGLGATSGMSFRW